MVFGKKNNISPDNGEEQYIETYPEMESNSRDNSIYQSVKKNRIVDLESKNGKPSIFKSMSRIIKSKAFLFPFAILLLFALSIITIKWIKGDFGLNLFLKKDPQQVSKKIEGKGKLPEIPPGNKDLDEGKTYYMKGWFPAAQSSFERVINSDAHDIHKAVALTYLGMISYDTEKYLRAIDFFERALKYNSRDPIIYRNMALAYRSRGLLKEAIDKAEKALELEPENARNYQLLGNIYFEAKDYKKAKEIYVKGLKKSPDDPMLYFNSGLVSYQMGDTPDAINNFHLAGRKAKLGKVAIQSNINLGKIYFQRRDFLKATQYFQTAHRLSPKNGDILFHLGNAQLEKGEKDAAMKSYEQALKLGSTNPALFEKLGDIYMRLKQFPAGIRAYEQAMEKSPANKTLLLAKLAELYYRSGNLEKAEEVYRKIISVAPGTNDARLAYIQLGNLMDDIENYDQAVALYTKAAELDPTDETPWINMGLSLKQAGRYNEARVALQKAIRVNPQKITPRMALATLYYEEGFFDEAMTEYVRILKSNTEHAQAHFYLANIYHKKNELNEAISGYKEVIRLQPKGKEGLDMIYKANLNLSLLLTKLGTSSKSEIPTESVHKVRQINFQNAIMYAKTAIQIRPKGAKAYFVLGQVYFLRNDMEDTVKALDLFRQVNTFPLADKKLRSRSHNNIGKCFFRMGKYVEAIQEFSRALDLWSENEEATLNRKTASLKYEQQLRQ